MCINSVLSPCGTTILSLFHNQCRDVFVASAFLRVEAVSEMLTRLLKDRSEHCRLRILTRASLPDVVTGSSDIASLTLLANVCHPTLSVQCRRDPRLHAKAYLIDGCKGIITSANLTPSGLLTNIEFGVFIDSADMVQSILKYIEPIWGMAEVVGDRVLKSLSAEAQHSVEIETPLEFDIDPEYAIGRKAHSTVKRRKALARLPATDGIRLGARWEELNKLGLNVEAALATIPLRKRRSSNRPRSGRIARTGTSGAAVTWLGMRAQQVYDIKDIEELKIMLGSPHWEFREAAAETLGNIVEEKATQVLLQALRREKDRDVVWSILLSLKPRITVSNLDQVLELLKRTDDPDLVYTVYLIASAVKPQEYARKLISKIPNFSDSECADEVANVLRPLSNDEFLEVVRNFKDKEFRLGRQLLLLTLSQRRGEDIKRQVQTWLFPQDSRGTLTGAENVLSPLIDSVIKSLNGKGKRLTWKVPSSETSRDRLKRLSGQKVTEKKRLDESLSDHSLIKSLTGSTSVNVDDTKNEAESGTEPEATGEKLSIRDLQQKGSELR